MIVPFVATNSTTSVVMLDLLIIDRVLLTCLNSLSIVFPTTTSISSVSVVEDSNHDIYLHASDTTMIFIKLFG